MVLHASEAPIEVVVDVSTSARRGLLALHSPDQRRNVRVGHTLVALDYDLALIVEIETVGMDYLRHDGHFGAFSKRRVQTSTTA